MRKSQRVKGLRSKLSPKEDVSFRVEDKFFWLGHGIRENPFEEFGL